MTYIVNDKCIKCKLMDCVEVCPVDCFYEGKNMLVIKPDECIDCGVCEPECPVDAIKADTEPGSEKCVEVNKKYSELWPNIRIFFIYLQPFAFIIIVIRYYGVYWTFWLTNATIYTLIRFNYKHIFAFIKTCLLYTSDAADE